MGQGGNKKKSENILKGMIKLHIKVYEMQLWQSLGSLYL